MALVDSTDPDLSRFAARGGKLILKEHMSDHALSPFAGVVYYKSVVDKLGQASVDSFIRFVTLVPSTAAGASAASTARRCLMAGALVQVAQEAKPPFAVTGRDPCAATPNGRAIWAA